MNPIEITPASVSSQGATPWRPSRRRIIQGGVAAGVVLSVPLLPLPALADERELTMVRQGIDPTVGTAAAPPIAAHGSLQPMQAAAAHRRLPVVESAEFRMVGLAWAGGPDNGGAARVRRGGTWGEWFELVHDPSEAPDPDEAPDTGRRTSPGIWVDRADAIELVVAEGITDVELLRVEETSRRALVASEATAGATPGILPRSAWSARPYNGTPSTTSDVRLAVVHHSATPNGYDAASVATMIRSMQNFHLDGQGWNDIAYNFIVDRFGRIWEGRAGGVDKGVIGGHTYGCNTGTIGVCYLGTLSDAVRMPAAAEQAIAALLSWKFNRVHTIGPSSSTYFAPMSSNNTSKYPAGEVRVHPTVVGHHHFSRTGCPGDASPPGRIRATLTERGDIRGASPAAGGPWDGFWLVSGSGQAHAHGWTGFYGSMAGSALNAPMISLAPTSDGRGYWMLAADGGIFTFGNARFHGSTGAMRLNKPVVGMAATKSGNGYWLVASDGGIFSFGDARFYGSTGGMRLNQPVIGMARTPSGNGYWLFASDGGIFTFGDARFFGSAGGGALPSPAVGVAVHPDARGYWLALANGTVRAFGNAAHRGNAAQPSSDPVVGITATADGGGYWLAARSGKVMAFGNAG